MDPVSPDKFELAVRILGNEVVAFSVSSESTKKNFIVIGAILAVLGSVLLNQLLPVIQAVM
jgi:hypothetical protein